MVRAAILDDYQNVAMAFADWSPIAKDVEIKVFNKPFGSQDEAIKALQGFAVVVGMRERTPFPRKVVEALPDLKLLITTGARNNSFDIKACAERGVTVCGTGAAGSPTTGIANVLGFIRGNLSYTCVNLLDSVRIRMLQYAVASTCLAD